MKGFQKIKHSIATSCLFHWCTVQSSPIFVAMSSLICYTQKHVSLNLLTSANHLFRLTTHPRKLSHQLSPLEDIPEMDMSPRATGNQCGSIFLVSTTLHEHKFVDAQVSIHWKYRHSIDQWDIRIIYYSDMSYTEILFYNSYILQSTIYLL